MICCGGCSRPAPASDTAHPLQDGDNFARGWHPPVPTGIAADRAQRAGGGRPAVAGEGHLIQELVNADILLDAGFLEMQNGLGVGFFCSQTPLFLFLRQLRNLAPEILNKLVSLLGPLLRLLLAVLLLCLSSLEVRPQRVNVCQLHGERRKI